MSLLTKLVGAALLVTVVASIGLPIVGIGSFHAADLMGTMPPWSEQTPYDFRPDNTLVSDTVNAVVPMRTAFRDRVWAGDLPMWNPLLGSGEPLAVVPNVGTFSPLTAAYLVAPLWFAPVLTKLAELAVAIAGMYLLARRWNLSRPAALFGALAFVNSAFVVVWTNWPQSHVGALVPAVFWAVERGITADRHRRAWPLAPIVAVMWLEGFPAVTAYTLATAGVYAIVRAMVVHGHGRRALARLAALAGAVLLSLGLAAIQLVPFLRFIGGLGLDYRQRVAGLPLDWELLTTLAVPDALGNPVDRVYYGAFNYVEGQSWVGVVVLLLIGTLVALRRRIEVPRGVLSFVAVVGVVGVVLVYFGTPLLDLVARIPLLGTNFIGRYRAVLAVLAAGAAAMGYESMLRQRGDDRDLQRTGWTLGALLLAMVPLGWVAASEAAEAGRLVYATMQAALPIVVAVVAAGVIVMHLRGHEAGPWQVLGLSALSGALLGGAAAGAVLLGVGVDQVVAAIRTTFVGVVVGAVAVPAVIGLAWWARQRGGMAFAALALPVLLAAEAIAFAYPWWARTPTELFYPPTAAHRHLEENLGHDRFAAAGSALYPGTNAVYGLRSVTAHAFFPVVYRDYLRALEPDAFARSTTFPFLSNTPETATSPLLDRAAARYWAAGPLDGIHGQVVPAVSGDDALAVGPDDELALPVDAGPLRGITLELLRSSDLSGHPAIEVEVRADAGEVLARGSTRLHHWVRPGPLPVALGEVEVPPGARIDVRLVGAETGEVVLAADGRTPAYVRNVPTDDGLRLAHVDGAVLYERTSAFPRIRWAGRSVIVPESEQRLAALADGVDRDVVVLSEGAAADDGASDATLRVLEDSGDVVSVEVDAAGGGFVVVADGIQSGWRAQLDGRDVPLLAADHAFAAVQVPAGRHEVQFVYDPPGWSMGQLVTLLSVLALAILIALDQRGERWSRREWISAEQVQAARADGRRTG